MLQVTSDEAPVSAGQRGRTRRFLSKLILIFFGFFIGVTVAEICLRVGGYSNPDLYILDQSRGFALHPNMEGWYRREGQEYVSINSDGLRDREHSKAKPPNTIRVAVIGDSYAEALQVPMHEAFWAVMEKRLQECDAFPGEKIEVLNFGVAGYGTAHELITLREHVWEYSPNIVLLAVTTSNDITDNSLKLKQKGQSPYFVFRDGRLVLDDSFKTSKGFRLKQMKISRFGNWIYDHSRVVQAASEGFRALRILRLTLKAPRNSSNPPQGEKATHEADIVARSEELGTDNVVYFEPQNPVWNDAWQVTEELIRTMRDEVKSKGARLMIVTLSNGPQVLPDPTSRQLFMQRFGIVDLFYPDNRIKSLGEREGIPVVTLAPEMQRYAEQQKVFLHGFGQDIGNGHWNATGHRVAGELIAKKLCEGGLLK